MSIKLVKEIELREFTPWSGAIETFNILLDRDDIDTVQSIIEDAYYDEDITETQLNDLLWFENDTIAEWLGYDSWDEYVGEDEENENESYRRPSSHRRIESINRTRYRRRIK